MVRGLVATLDRRPAHGEDSTVDTPTDVDAYIAGAASDARPVLAALRELIRSTLPDVDEIRFDQDVPAAAIQRILRARARANEAKGGRMRGSDRSPAR
jgi:hypothetical protein